MAVPNTKPDGKLLRLNELTTCESEEVPDMKNVNKKMQNNVTYNESSNVVATSKLEKDGSTLLYTMDVLTKFNLSYHLVPIQVGNTMDFIPGTAHNTMVAEDPHKSRWLNWIKITCL